jgi:hypothetical protein
LKSINIFNFKYSYSLKIYYEFSHGDWGLGIGDGGLGIGDWAQSPIPNPHPQSPIPNPQSPFFKKIN